MIAPDRAKLRVSRTAVGVGLAGLTAGLLATNLAFTSTDSSSLHPVAAAVVAAAIVSVIISRVAPGDRRLQTILALGFALKMVGVVARYQVSVRVYGGLFDAGYYHDSASQVAEWIRSEGFVARTDPRVNFRESGTTSLAYFFGWLYYFTGPRVLTGFVVAASMGYVGMLAFVRAGIESIPGLDRHRYAAMVVFLPTLVYWPSSIGKEAWMVCWLGLGTLGAARVCRGIVAPRSLIPLVVGLGAAGWVRPHIAALAFAALIAALLWPTGMKGNRVQQVLALAVASIALLVALGAVRSTFERFSAEETGDFSALLEGTANQTTQGGSEFAAQTVTGPVSFARAIVTVLFRPFPWEASNAAQLLTSLEGIALLGLALWTAKHFKAVPQLFRDVVYLRFAFAFTLGFAFAYANIGNFGILARQRSQLFPLLLVFFALGSRLPKEPGSSSTIRLHTEVQQTQQTPV